MYDVIVRRGGHCRRPRFAWPLQAQMAAALLLASAGFVSADGDVRVDFSKEIRPILADKCFQCHGFDEARREAGLRLDQREDAVRLRNGLAAIHPGRPELSELVRRIQSPELDERMPPPESHKALSEAEIAKLSRWIEQGAPYELHWAFRRVERPQLPAVGDSVRIANPIDAFILARLESEGLSLSAPADAHTLLRRLWIDVVGLLPPPSALEKLDGFPVGAPMPRGVLAEMVDELLSNVHYGERWGRHWLDRARYADSHGFTVDGPRVMWPYRDWVIASLNRDMPFDQFTIEQLAGDLLDAPTKNQIIATAFHRNSMINQEGGVKADQFRHEAIIDRVNTTGAVWLGLTIGCAQCHAHKFDPISQEEYYRLYAFFGACEDANNSGPTIDVHVGEAFGLSESRRQELESLRLCRQELAELTAREKSRRESASWSQLPWRRSPISDYRTASNATFQKLEDDSLLSDQNGSENDSYHIVLPPPEGEVAALRLRVLTHPSLPKSGPGLAKNGNFILTDIELQVDGRAVRFSQAFADVEQTEYRVSNAIDGDKATGWAINVDGANRAKGHSKMNANHEAVFVLEKPEAFHSAVTVVMRHDRNKNYLIGRLGFDWSNQPPSNVPIEGSNSAAERIAELKKAIGELETRLPEQGRPAQLMVYRDLKNPPKTYRLERGDFLRPDARSGPLRPGVPASLAASDNKQMRNRLDLARWLVDRENPLTARVTVNRIWQQYFGRGLVETENDFGFQGTPPDHPELLDWLAAEFMESGWSLKRLHRLILLSNVYAQSSADTERRREIDPANRLFSRQQRLRVEAEIVRDLALSASGLLNTAIGGPSVHPPQPADVYRYTQTMKTWPESKGPDRYRRTMYTTFYRSAPHPLLATFDAPDFCNACTSRVRSNTPLQALAVANDPMFLELAEGLADQAISAEIGTEAGLRDRVRWMFRRCMCRAPSNDELIALLDFAERERSRIAMCSSFDESDPESRRRLDRQTLTRVARVLFNCDEFIVRN